MKFDTDEEFQLALKEYRRQFPWVDETMAGIMLRTPEEKLDEIWEKVKHDKFKPKSTNLIIVEDAYKTYTNEDEIPPPPTTLTPEQIEECQKRCPKGAPMILELDNTWSEETSSGIAG